MPSKQKSLSIDRPLSKDTQVFNRKGYPPEIAPIGSKKPNFGRIKLTSLRDVPKKIGTMEGQIATLMAPYLKSILQRPDKPAASSTALIIVEKNGYKAPVERTNIEVKDYQESTSAPRRLIGRLERPSSIDKSLKKSNSTHPFEDISSKEESIDKNLNSNTRYISRVSRISSNQDEEENKYRVSSVSRDEIVTKEYYPPANINLKHLELIEEEDSAVLRHLSDDFSSQNTAQEHIRFGENTNQSIGLSLEKYNKEFSSVERHLNIVGNCKSGRRAEYI